MQVLQAWLEKVAGIHSLKESVGVGKWGSNAGGATEIIKLRGIGVSAGIVNPGAPSCGESCVQAGASALGCGRQLQ